jgi:hypothetical protein
MSKRLRIAKVPSSVVWISKQRVSTQGWIVDENWYPDPEESFLLRLRPAFETEEAAFEWIRSGVFMLFQATTDSVLVIDGDYQLLAEWSLADDFVRCQNPKGKEQLNIHLDCNEQIAREASEQGHINALREKVKAVAGIYPHEAVKQHYKEILEPQEARAGEEARGPQERQADAAGNKRD